MHPESRRYNESQADGDQAICDLLAREIDNGLPEAENKVWHGHPVWFLEGNPIVGYSKLEDCVRLLFWSGQSFETAGLEKERQLQGRGSSVHLGRGGGRAVAARMAARSTRRAMGLQEPGQAEG